MTTQIISSSPQRQRRRLPTAVPAAIVAVIVVRLLQARAGASSDEGGFLLLAGQWHAGGSSLYGDYWVDRPPLLIGIFRLADLTGGLVPLRVIGALAASATIALLASTALRVFGPRAATWTALVAAALLVSPLYGAVDINGELLALPLVALGIRAAVEAVMAEDRMFSRGAALVAGLAAVSALLVKQNMADVIIFAVVCWLIAWRSGRLDGRGLWALFGFATIGGALAYAVVMLSAMAHGTSPYAVYEATYPFRLEAARVIAASTSATAGERLHQLGLAFVLSGAPVLVLAFAARAVRQSRAPWVVWGLIATGLWAGFSVLAGGSYWLHYLVESVPVVALAAGALSLHSPRLLRAAVAVVVASAMLAAGVAVFRPTATPGTAVGAAVAVAAEPGDTMVSLFGEPEIVRSAGMSSPYPYLWSLPARTLDPDLVDLRSLLAGVDAPTWLVVRGPATMTRLSDHGAMDVVDHRYRLIGRVCGRDVFLLREADRPVPVADERCSGGAVLP